MQLYWSLGIGQEKKNPVLYYLLKNFNTCNLKGSFTNTPHQPILNFPL